MPSPRRQLLDAMLLCLRKIRKPEYVTDLGAVVTDEPGQVTSENLPSGSPGAMAVFVERQAVATDTAVSRTHRLTMVTVIAKVPAELDHAQDALDAAVSDIEAAMDAQQVKFPVGIQYPRYSEMQPIQQADGSNFIGALVRYQTHIPKR